MSNFRVFKVKFGDLLLAPRVENLEQTGSVSILSYVIDFFFLFRDLINLLRNLLFLLLRLFFGELCSFDTPEVHETILSDLLLWENVGNGNHLVLTDVNCIFVKQRWLQYLDKSFLLVLVQPIEVFMNHVEYLSEIVGFICSHKLAILHFQGCSLENLHSYSLVSSWRFQEVLKEHEEGHMQRSIKICQMIHKMLFLQKNWYYLLVNSTRPTLPNNYDEIEDIFT